VAYGRVLDRSPAGERARPGAGLDERDRSRQIELEAARDPVGEEEVRVDLVVDRELVAAAGARRGDADDDRPGEVRRHEAEAELTGGQGLGAADGGEALRARVRPVGVAVDAGARERVVALLRTSFRRAQGQEREHTGAGDGAARGSQC